jgi:NUMOD4 motif/HNH endonuclease
MDPIIRGEIWKFIKGHENYKVSNTGKIINVTTKYEKKIVIHKKGHCVCTLTNKGKYKQYIIHRLVASTFIANPDNHKGVMHIDGDKTNNNYENLKFVARTELKRNIMIKKISQFNIDEIVSLPNEKWKSITGYDNYVISTEGRVINKETNKFLKLCIASGYYSINLCNLRENKKAKPFRTHRLVAQEFVHNPDPQNKIYVDHINNDKLDNKSSNLRWVTPKENTNHYIDNHREEPGKTVLQYKNTELVKRWKCVNEIIRQNPEYNESTLRKRVFGNREYKGYRWKYGSTKNPFKKIDGEKFKNAGIIDGFDCCNYEISDYGRIKNVSRNTINKLTTDLGGYQFIQLYHKGNGKCFLVHYLVATLFVPGKTEARRYVNHIDENRSNNRADNLEWCTLKENSDHSISRKINQIDSNTGDTINYHKSIRDAARHMQPDRKRLYTNGIANCCHNRQKQYAGFKWQFAADTPIPKIPENIEVWKQIKHYPSYELSNTGKARNITTKRELHQSIMKDGRRMINLNKNGMRKKFAIHILIAKHFIQDFENDYVFHIDGDKSNNSSSNLKIESRKEAKAKVELKKNPKIKNIKGEIWKNIENFESYKISNKGRVQNNKTGRLLKQSKKITQYDDSYKVVMLRKKSGKETTVMMHRLMAETFIDNSNEYEFIQHIDEDRCNNKLENIIWVDRDDIYYR